MQTKKLLIVLMVLFIPSSLLAQDGFYDSNLGVRFPGEMGGLKFQWRYTYEKPSLGYSIRYQDDSLFKIDIYVYNNNIQKIGSGIGSEKIKREFASVLMVFPYMQKIGKYKEVKFVEKGEKTLGKTKFLWAQYTYRQTKGEGTLYLGRRLSDTYLVGKNDLFIKVRLTLKKEDFNQKAAAKNKFLKDLGDLLGEGS